jgi:hypothetical protein
MPDAKYAMIDAQCQLFNVVDLFLNNVVESKQQKE